MSTATNHGETIHYITVATKPHKVLDKILANVKKNKEFIEVLGLHENRLIGWEGTQNFGVKLREIYNYVYRPILNPTDIVLFTDAYDVAYLGNLKEVVRRYKMFSKPIVFGAEKSCHPDPLRESEYHLDGENLPEFPFLNSGLIIGRVDALRHCMKDYHFDDRHDDQRFWTTVYFENQEKIELDYENLLFLNAADMEMENFVWNGKTAWYKRHNPLFVHINGPDKSMIETFL